MNTINNIPSNSNLKSKTWKNYQFEIEKYLGQMSGNPYLNELEDDLYKEKRQKLTSLIDDPVISYLENYLIDEIFKKTVNDHGLKSFTTNIKNLFINFNFEKESFPLNINDLNSKKIGLIKNNLKKFKFSDLETKALVLNPTKLRISTMTVCCEIGTNIDTKYLYEKFIIPSDILNQGGCSAKKTKYKPEIKEMVIGAKAENFPQKGYFEKDKKSNFFNSAALNVLISPNKCINVKVFKNGKLQMTGVPSEERGAKAVDVVIDLIKSIPDDSKTGKRIVFDKKRLKCSNYRTVLINSDYFCGYEIQRENLAEILCNKYDLSVTFESENYPGVKLEYFWNQTTLGSNTEGQCRCTKRCIGRGTGNGDKDCKKITISTFQSGKVIVTGARSTKQLDSAYKFINRIFYDNYDLLKKKTKSNKDKLKLSVQQCSNSKVFFLKKNNVENYALYQKLINSEK